MLAYCSDDVVYEDPAVGVRIAGKAAIRDGMLSHVGDYRGTREQSGLVVLSRLIGRQAVAVEVRETFQVERDGALQTIDRRKLKVLEFHEGRIRRVLDY